MGAPPRARPAGAQIAQDRAEPQKAPACACAHGVAFEPSPVHPAPARASSPQEERTMKLILRALAPFALLTHAACGGDHCAACAQAAAHAHEQVSNENNTTA